MNNNFNELDDILDNEIKLTEDEMNIIKNININYSLNKSNSKINIDFSQIFKYPLELIKSNYKKIIIGCLTLIFIILILSLPKIDNPYHHLENEIESYAYDFSWMEKVEIAVNDKYSVSLNDIKKLLLVNKTSELNKCDGYVTIKNKNHNYKYKGYIKCNDYQTKGYKGVG